MSLLSVAQVVADEVGLTAPSVIFGSTDRTAKQLRRLINRAGRELAQKDWSILQKEHTFETVNGTASYDLPDDYARLITNSVWNRDTYWSLRGQLSPQAWQVQKSALVATTTIRQNFRIKPDTRVNKFFVDPTPSTDDTLVFEYISSEWVKNASNSSGETQYTADDDISLIDERLLELECIWRFLARRGFAYEEEREEAKAAIDKAFADDLNIGMLNFGTSRASPLSRLNIPEGGFG